MAKAPARKTPPKPKAKPANAEHEPTDELRSQVEKLATLGLTRDEIATVVGLGRTTVGKHYKAELKAGVVKSKVAIMNSGYRMSVGAEAVYDARGRVLREEVKPDRSVLIFMMKARCGLRETTRLEHTGKDGGSIKTESKKVTIQIAPDDLDV